ncbi:MAG TPA: bacillithiol biosynthesis cysteine-adding enzyme BshC [bacterium]|nr:bacillithiol biosynthesis cysteine-adding enzyme BshC [bacterium]
MRLTNAARAVAVPSRASGFAMDSVRGEEKTRAFLPRQASRWLEEASGLAQIPRRAPAATVWARALAGARRLGASAKTIENVQLLNQGNALCVATGQQPGILLGPLLVLYKTMSAIRLAEKISAVTRRPVVPVFWIAGDDSDYTEISSVFFPDEEFRIERRALQASSFPAGGMIGNLPVETTSAIVQEFRDRWSTSPDLVRRLERACEIAQDHGEITAALLYEWFGEWGLVIVDGRWPELRSEARELLERWLEHRSAVEEDVVRTGRELERAGYRAQISEVSAGSGLFDIRSAKRLPFEGDGAALRDRIREEPESLSPNVVMRPLIQDFLLPNVATVAGRAEIAYHAQLAPVYARLGVAMPVLVPRMEATLVPAGVFELAERRRAAVEDFVFDFDAALRATSANAVPRALNDSLQQVERSIEDGMRKVADAAQPMDAKLASFASDAAQRLRDTLEKFRARVAEAARDAERRRDPRLRNYREFLTPFGDPQERVLSSLALFLENEARPIERFLDFAGKHADGLREREVLHWLSEVSGERLQTT